MAELVRPGSLITTGLHGSPVKKDADFPSVVLLSGFNGVDASTTLTDESSAAHTLTAAGNAQLDTAQKKFGTASLLLDGVDDFGWSADSADWNLGAGDFTIEAWVRMSAFAAPQSMISQWNATGNQRGWRFIVNTGGGITFGWTTGGITEVQIGFVGPLVANTWGHMAVVRSGNTMHQFVDGTSIGTGDMTGVTIFNSTALLRIGGDESSGLLVNDFGGWVDELRLTKGVARYTANFTPSGKPWPRS